MSSSDLPPNLRVERWGRILAAAAVVSVAVAMSIFAGYPEVGYAGVIAFILFGERYVRGTEKASRVLVPSTVSAGVPRVERPIPELGQFDLEAHPDLGWEPAAHEASDSNPSQIE